MTTFDHDMTALTTLLALPPDLVQRDRVRRQALRVGAVRHDGLARLREAAFAGEGLALTWEIPREAGALPSGESALAALAPVAAGLALLHDAGLAHGGISRASIHVHHAGGVITGWRPGGTPEGDVADLVALLDDCLPPASVHADIAQLLIAAADPDPTVRPTMARVAAVLERTAVAGAPYVSPPAHRRARLGEAPPPRPTEPTAPGAASRRPESPSGRGRHAARRASAGRSTLGSAGRRLPWKWAVAIAGGTAAVLLGVSAVGSAGSAQEICPAPSSAADAAGSR